MCHAGELRRERHYAWQDLQHAEMCVGGVCGGGVLAMMLQNKYFLYSKFKA